MIRLLTRGDDMGSFRAANRAIKDAYQQGILRNTSLMVPAPYFTEAAQILRDLPDLCVGLHATINCEWHEMRWGPVLGAERVPSLVLADGTFYKDTVDLYQHHARNEEIMAELEAQLALARDAGVRIQYMDVHMCFDWFDGLQPLMQEFAQREGLFFAAWQGSDANIPLESLPTADGDFTDPVEELLARLDNVDPTMDKPYWYVMHPCYHDEEIARVTCGNQHPGEMAAQRDIDRQLLMDPRLVAYCSKRDIHLTKYSELPR